MDLIDHTWPTPAENLAADEALLDAAESGERGETLRFWQSPVPFVVLGHSNRVATEVNLQRCIDLNIPVLRRCSGGGTVLQDPGSLSYALVLQINRHPDLESATSANRFIMLQQTRALSELLGREVRCQGTTDLVLGDRKISGNAQRRRRHFLLFHGTFLLNANLQLMELLLPSPSRMPDYRLQRRHLDFLGHIDCPPSALKNACSRLWDARPCLKTLPDARISALVAHKYSQSSWNQKF